MQNSLEDVLDEVQEAALGVGSRQKIAELGLRVVELLLRKNADYGDSAWTSPMLAGGVSVRQAIAVRMSDKLSRWQKLVQSSGSVSESLEKTMVDFIGYGILWLGAEDITAEDLWETPPKKMPAGIGTPEYDAMPPVIEQVHSILAPPHCGPGFRLVTDEEKANGPVDPRAQFFSDVMWLPRWGEGALSPYNKNLIYRVPIDPPEEA